MVQFRTEQLEAELKWLWPEGMPFGPTLHVYEELGSTSDRLNNLLKTGAPAGTTVLAQTQTQGRGQQGRTWVSASGGLYLSMALACRCPAQEAARLTLGNAWGVATALREQAIPVALKWPNDILLERRKLGGILTESRLRGGEIYQAVVGVGLNWANDVPEPGIILQPFLAKTQNLRITSLETLAAVVLRGLALGYQKWQARDVPLSNLLEDYEKFVNLQGRPVEVCNQWGKIIGISSVGEIKVQFDGPVADLPSTVVNGAKPCAGQNLRPILRFPPGSINLGYD